MHFVSPDGYILALSGGTRNSYSIIDFDSTYVEKIGNLFNTVDVFMLENQYAKNIGNSNEDWDNIPSAIPLPESSYYTEISENYGQRVSTYEKDGRICILTAYSDKNLIEFFCSDDYATEYAEKIRLFRDLGISKYSFIGNFWVVNDYAYVSVHAMFGPGYYIIAKKQADSSYVEIVTGQDYPVCDAHSEILNIPGEVLKLCYEPVTFEEVHLKKFNSSSVQ